jgi:hypothetical protein
VTHELADAFRSQGLTLRRTLEDMLNETPDHRTERRGCGFTQATRFLGTFINQAGAADDPGDLGLFEDWPMRTVPFAAATALAAGWPHGWRRLDEFEWPWELNQLEEQIGLLVALRRRFQAAVAALCLHESRILAGLAWQILARDGDAPVALPAMPAKPEVGSCSQAEEFFLELAHRRVRRGGSVNVFVDAQQRPVLIEKMNLGESHSAMVLAPVSLNRVVLPPGALCALAHVACPSPRATANGTVLPLAAIAEARFLRLTTLAVEPASRQRVFSAQMDAQRRAGMLSPDSTTLAELRAFAAAQAGQPE